MTVGCPGQGPEVAGVAGELGGVWRVEIGVRIGIGVRDWVGQRNGEGW